MEKAYIDEYNLIAAKNKAEGKDFNYLAYDELKAAKHMFQYLRTNEKIYQLEKLKEQTPLTPKPAYKSVATKDEGLKVDAKVEEEAIEIPTEA